MNTTLYVQLSFLISSSASLLWGVSNFVWSVLGQPERAPHLGSEHILSVYVLFLPNIIGYSKLSPFCKACQF